jgi:translation initiation factor IF-2
MVRGDLLTKIRIYQLAKELKLSSTQIMADLTEIGIEVKNHMSAIDDLDALKVRKKYMLLEKKTKAVEFVEQHHKPVKKEVKKPEKVHEQPKKATVETHAKPQHKTPEKPQHKPQQKTTEKPQQRSHEKPKTNTNTSTSTSTSTSTNTHNSRPQSKPVNKNVSTPSKNIKKAVQTTTATSTKDKKPATNDKKKTGKAQTPAVQNRPKRDYSKKTKKSKTAYKRPKDDDPMLKLGSTVILPQSITVAEFSDMIGMEPNDLILKLMEDYELMLAMNANLEMDVAELLAVDLGYVVEKEKTEQQLNFVEFEFKDDPKDLITRSPIVTVMGHVDHGKTSLLDAIRNTNVTEGEAGGITQHIGASEIIIKDKKIVFLDTPGHEAFTSLRARGAKVTDIAILVVAADDGVMPQTIEAIDHAKAAGVPIIVAINKIDKNNANPDRVKQELSDKGLVVEEWGGDTIAVEVSAIQGKGIESLLEMVLLAAEMQELKANPKRPALGFVIEANLDKGRGPVATIIVQNGTLSIGDAVFVGKAHGKIRAMFNSKGKRVEQAGPANTVEILGLSEVPVAGEKFYVTDDEKIARSHSERSVVIEKEQAMRANRKSVTLEDIFSQIKDGEIKDLNIILKADVHGSMEALRQSLEKLSNEEVRVNIIHSQIGAITESDVLLGTASNAIIIGFNVRPSTNVTLMASIENVEIRTYRIIYEAIKEVKDALSGLLDPEYREVIEGKIEVRTTFKVPNIGMIAGAYVTDGKVTRKSSVRLVRDGIVVFEGKITSLKRFKDDAKEVLKGFECGIGLENYNDLKEGDVIETFYIQEIERTLD